MQTMGRTLIFITQVGLGFDNVYQNQFSVNSSYNNYFMGNFIANSGGNEVLLISTTGWGIWSRVNNTNYQYVQGSTSNDINSSNRITIGDFVGNDGISDILITADNLQGGYWSGYKLFSRNSFTGNFDQVGSGYYPSWGEHIYVGDFNNDQRQDLFVTADTRTGTSWSGWKIFHSNNDGTFGLSAPYNITPNSSNYYPSWGERIHIGDFNGDGFDEFMTTTNIDVNPSGFNGYEVWHNTTNSLNPQFAKVREDKIANYPSWGERIHIGDFNGDGNDDVAVTSDLSKGVNKPGVEVYLMNEEGNYMIYANNDRGSQLFSLPMFQSIIGWQNFKIYKNTQNNISTLNLVNMNNSKLSVVLMQPVACDNDPASGYAKPVQLSNNNSIYRRESKGKSDDTFFNIIRDDKILVYPNPTRDIIILKSTHGKIISIQVMDYSGRVLLERRMHNSNDEATISLVNQPKGIYLVRVRTEEGAFSTMVIKK